ncbi:MAG: sigma-70 family RNA polymerase sigma factor [Verrucomicrobiales bacterium]
MALTVKNSNPPEGSHQNFADLLAAHQPRLAAYIRSLTADEQVSRDILQETNVTLLKKSRDFQPGTNFTAWSFRVAYFEVLTWRRGKGRDRLHFDDELVESIAVSSEKVSTSYDDRLDVLKGCIPQLPDRQREIIQRRYLDSESVQDIAADLGFKANAASQLLHRARTNLLKCINQNTTANTVS